MVRFIRALIATAWLVKINARAGERVSLRSIRLAWRDVRTAQQWKGE